MQSLIIVSSPCFSSKVIQKIKLLIKDVIMTEIKTKNANHAHQYCLYICNELIRRHSKMQRLHKIVYFNCRKNSFKITKVF